MAKQQTTKSIYDFIYLDIDRIHSYYAQLTDGVPNQKTISENESLTTKRGMSALPRDVVHVTGEQINNQDIGFQQSMDMAHVLPKDMINLLDEHNFIHKKLSKDNLGKLVLIKGLLHFSDFETLAKVSDIFIDLDPFADESDDDIENRNIELKMLSKTISAYQLQIKATLQVQSTSKQYAWMALDKKYLTNAHAVSVLQHNICSPEEFYVLGIVDATPDKFTEKEDKERIDNFYNHLNANNQDSLSAEAISATNEAYKTFLGRNKDYYGITPISIFRELKASS